MKLVAILVLALALVACAGGTPRSQQIEQATTERNQSQLNASQPVPQFDFSQDRDTLIQVYKLRNEARNTWTVFLSTTGVPLYSCPSIGFPIPGSTQLTNPQQAIRPYAGGTDVAVIAQAEPNGLYTDPNTMSTWVICVRANGDAVPVYAEPQVITFPFPVEVKDGKIAEVAGAPSSAKVEVKRGR
jgi:hypothetical protein